MPPADAPRPTAATGEDTPEDVLRLLDVLCPEPAPTGAAFARLGLTHGALYAARYQIRRVLDALAAAEARARAAEALLREAVGRVTLHHAYGAMDIPAPEGECPVCWEHRDRRFFERADALLHPLDAARAAGEGGP